MRALSNTSPSRGAPAPARNALEPAALLTLGALSFTWSWWAWQEGAYFVTVLLPGVVLLCIVTALLAGFVPWRANLALSPPAKLALYALGALGAWTLLSGFWTPSPDQALADGQRVLGYALAFGLGIWLCNLLGPRMRLSLVPLAAAGGFAGVATAYSLITGDNPRQLLELDGTLDYPLGYRNATGAFFAIAMLPAVGLAADPDLDWRLRGLALGIATLCADFFLLAQSRGSLIAAPIAVIVFILVYPARVRALSWLALAVLPALAIVPALSALYGAANDGGVVAAASEMQTAGTTAAITALAAALLGAIAARNERRIPGLRATVGEGHRAVAVGFLAAAVLACGAFVAAVGDPVDWIADRGDEFRSSGTPNLSDASSRFSLNAGSERYDLWRVAIDDFLEDPLFGNGAGGFQYTYAAERELETHDARDAHSVELELLAELGLPGLLLFALAGAGAIAGVLRARRLGPTAAALGAVALAVGAYWLVHASIDWFWPYPALTAPMIALLGSACAPAVLDLRRRRREGWRPWLVAAAVVFALSVVPPYLSQRYIDGIAGTAEADPEQAMEDLELAQDLNPLSDTPILIEAELARVNGDRERAIDAFQRAIDMRPEEWAGRVRLAQLLAPTDRRLAQNQARVALELNPLSPRVQALAERLGLDVEAELEALE